MISMRLMNMHVVSAIHETVMPTLLNRAKQTSIPPEFSVVAHTDEIEENRALAKEKRGIRNHCKYFNKLGEYVSFSLNIATFLI